MLPTPTDETTAQRRVEELRAKFELPKSSTLQEVFLQEVRVGGLALRMAGLVAATPEGATLTGAAADEHGFPVDRAYFELLERLSIFVARESSRPLRVRDRSARDKGGRKASEVFPADKQPDSVRTSLSNGVALHTSWPLACDAALNELIERDRVLRSFAGEYAPRALPDADAQLSSALEAIYDVQVYTFGPPRAKLSHVANGVFLFPRTDSAPLVYGFGAGTDVASAHASAKREALQRLAFLWGEDLPEAPPPAAPEPDYHQEYYLYPGHHAILRDWLSGKRARARSKATKARKLTSTNIILDSSELVRFIDLTPSVLRDLLYVAKAVSARAKPLRFGISRGRRRSQTPPHPIA
jgi:YcaO cyclodehydratase, ATP-ad Mg2+-binding